MSGYGVPVVKSSIVKRQSSSYSVGNDGDKVLGPFGLQPEQMDANKFYYGSRIVTSPKDDAGTMADVYVTLIGNKAATKDLALRTGVEAIDKSTYLDLIIEAEEELDDVEVVLLGNTGKGMELGGAWLVDYTMIYNITNLAEKMFPCYHWVSNRDYVVSTTAKTTTLNDIKSNEVLKRERTNQLEQRQSQYKWKLYPKTGVPSGIDENMFNLPDDEEFSRVKNIDFTSDALKAVKNLGLLGLVLSVEDLQDYVTLTQSLAEKGDLSLYQGSRWVTDVEFGRQMLNGSNPVVIKKCSKLVDIPHNFPVKDGMVRKFFTRPKNLEQEMEAGHIYLCDLRIMDGFTPREGCFAPAPICLLYVNSSDELVPIAIQIKQGIRQEEKKEHNPIFFPDDHWIDWLLAKIYYQASNSQFHQLSTHYFSCHAAMEAYGMGTMRNLPDAHPVSKLLYPHFRFTMAINARARATLINPNGVIALSFGIGGPGQFEAFSKVSKEYSVDWTNIKKDLKKRGMDVPNQPPRYHWRDDGVKVWDALESFVKGVIDTFYSSDEDVKHDTELIAWSEDLFNNGFAVGEMGGSEGHDFPKAITTKELLIEQCTRIMFTGSAQHSSVNFLQNFIYGFVPNAPFAVRRPPPTKKGLADNQTLFNTLPDKAAAVLDLVLVYTLSRYSSDDIYIGNYPNMKFTEPSILKLIEKTSAKLAVIAKEIKERNETLDVPYPYMSPPNITNSITI